MINFYAGMAMWAPSIATALHKEFIKNINSRSTIIILQGLLDPGFILILSVCHSRLAY